MKRILGFFRRNRTPDEKTPFAKDIPVGRRGDMRTGLDVPCRRRSEPGPAVPAKELEDRPPMSLLRKLCVFLSLNAGVAYVAVLMWAIPCRHRLCLPHQKEWQANLSAVLTSNIATTKYAAGRSSLVILGYSDENGAHLGAWSASDGSEAWNTSSDHIIRHVFCPPESSVLGCAAAAYGHVGVFNALNGQMVWERNITDPAGKIIHRMVTARDGLLLGVSDTHLLLTDFRNGSGVSTIPHPCPWAMDRQLVGPWTTANRTLWNLVCQYGDSLEVWTFQEEQLLNPTDGNKKAVRDDARITLLFSRESGSGSIDLAGDVTSMEDSFAVSWADRVVMVTNQVLSQRLQVMWERRFSEPYSPASVTSINSGHFTNMHEKQTVVTVQEGSNTTVHILENKNGTTVATVHLGTMTVSSTEKIPGGKDETDILVLESVQDVDRAKDDTTELSAQQMTHYFAIQSTGKEVVIHQDLISSDVYASTLSPSTEGFADLLVASRTADGGTLLRRLVVGRGTAFPPCHSETNFNMTTMMLD